MPSRVSISVCPDAAVICYMCLLWCHCGKCFHAFLVWWYVSFTWAMPGESHLVGRAKRNRPGCLHGVFSLPTSKKLLSLFGIPVAHVFIIDNAAFHLVICLKVCFTDLMFELYYKSFSRKRGFSHQINIGYFRLNKYNSFLHCRTFKSLKYAKIHCKYIKRGLFCNDF